MVLESAPSVVVRVVLIADSYLSVVVCDSKIVALVAVVTHDGLAIRSAHRSREPRNTSVRWVKRRMRRRNVVRTPTGKGLEFMAAVVSIQKSGQIERRHDRREPLEQPKFVREVTDNDGIAVVRDYFNRRKLVVPGEETFRQR